MGDAFCGRTLQWWVNRFHPDLGVLCLQELKAQKSRIDFQLRTLFPQGRFMVDYLVEGRIGVTVGVISNLPIIDQGVKGDGCFAWYTLDTNVGLVNFGSVYAPNE